MTAELHKEASKGYSEKYLSYRKRSINTLVDFYQKCIENIEALEAQILEVELRYSALHKDVQKLVTYCGLHGVNPNEIFFWDDYDLEIMIRKNLMFVLPAINLSEHTDIDEHVNIFPFERKFLTAKLLMKGAKHA